MSHFATLAALRFALRVYARTRHNKSEFREFRDLGHIIRGAKDVEHRGGGNLESGRTDGEGEDGAGGGFRTAMSRMLRWCNGLSCEAEVRSRSREFDLESTVWRVNSEIVWRETHHPPEETFPRQIPPHHRAV